MEQDRENEARRGRKIRKGRAAKGTEARVGKPADKLASMNLLAMDSIPHERYSDEEDLSDHAFSREGPEREIILHGGCGEVQKASIALVLEGYFFHRASPDPMSLNSATAPTYPNFEIVFIHPLGSMFPFENDKIKLVEWVLRTLEAKKCVITKELETGSGTTINWSHIVYQQETDDIKSQSGYLGHARTEVTWLDLAGHSLGAFTEPGFGVFTEPGLGAFAESGLGAFAESDPGAFAEPGLGAFTKPGLWAFADSSAYVATPEYYSEM
ncbi:hypothetical protein TWF281_002135 [Arthrobotrys megalospora]